MDFGDFDSLARSAASDTTVAGADSHQEKRPDVASQEALETIETIETGCLELSAHARRHGLRHVEFLLQIAAQEAAVRRTPPKRARGALSDRVQSKLQRLGSVAA
jgi:hypothetical protein